MISKVDFERLFFLKSKGIGSNALAKSVADLSIERFIRKIGVVAQLVERLLCKQNVVGSIPSGSTKTRSLSSVG